MNHLRTRFSCPGKPGHLWTHIRLGLAVPPCEPRHDGDHRRHWRSPADRVSVVRCAVFDEGLQTEVLLRSVQRDCTHAARARQGEEEGRVTRSGSACASRRRPPLRLPLRGHGRYLRRAARLSGLCRAPVSARTQRKARERPPAWSPLWRPAGYSSSSRASSHCPSDRTTLCGG